MAVWSPPFPLSFSTICDGHRGAPRRRSLPRCARPPDGPSELPAGGTNETPRTCRSVRRAPLRPASRAADPPTPPQYRGEPGGGKKKKKAKAQAQRPLRLEAPGLGEHGRVVRCDGVIVVVEEGEGSAEGAVVVRAEADDALAALMRGETDVKAFVATAGVSVHDGAEGAALSEKKAAKLLAPLLAVFDLDQFLSKDYCQEVVDRKAEMASKATPAPSVGSMAQLLGSPGVKSVEKAILKLQLGELRDPDMSGVILKQGKLNKAFRRRWCLLFDSALLYYKPPLTKMSKPTGVILFDAQDVAAADSLEAANKFTLTVGGRVLRCLDAEARQEWLSALRAAAPVADNPDEVIKALRMGKSSENK